MIVRFIFLITHMGLGVDRASIHLRQHRNGFVEARPRMRLLGVVVRRSAERVE